MDKSTGCYPGLRPFTVKEGDLFFGRDRQSLRMITTLLRQHFLAVVGTSGCGKSSLVKAGLLPELSKAEVRIGESDREWVCVVTRPGGGPFRNLALELAKHSPEKEIIVDPTQVEKRLRAGTDGLIDAIYSVPGLASRNVLIVIDQFEELFRFGDTTQRRISELERTQVHDDALAFVDALLSTVEARNPQIYVAITMRSDSLGRCDLFHGLPEAITRSQFLPPRMTKEQLLDAVRRPLEQFHSTIEDAVVSDLLESMGDRQDQLPVVQHALAQLWTFASEGKSLGEPRHITINHAERCRRNTEGEMHVSNRLGWVTDAISTHADAVFESLASSPAGARPAADVAERQEIARAMFCALSQIDNNEEPERRLTSIDEVAQIVFGDEVSDSQLRKTESVAQAFADEGDNFISPSVSADGHHVLDISHECLLRQWKRLQAWIADEANSAQQYRRLRVEVDNNTRFLTDTHLSQAQEWVTSRRPNANWARRYDGAESTTTSVLPSCLELIARSHAERQRSLRTDRETVKRLRWLTSFTALMFFSTAFGWTYSWVNLQKANAAIVSAEQKQREADTEKIKARNAEEKAIASLKKVFLNLASSELDQGRLAAGITHLWSAYETSNRKSILGLIGSWSANIPIPMVYDEAVRGVAERTSDHAYIAVTRDSSKGVYKLDLWQLIGNKPKSLGTVPIKNDLLSQPLLSSDGEWALLVREQEVQLVSTVDGSVKSTLLIDSTEEIQEVAINRDATLLLTTRKGTPNHINIMQVWNLSDKKHQTVRDFDIHTLLHDASITSIAIGGTNEDFLVVFGTIGGAVGLWRPTATEAMRGEVMKNAHGGRVEAVSLSSDLNQLIAGSVDLTASCWVIDNNQLRRAATLPHDNVVTAVTFNSDSTAMLTGCRNGAIRIWNTENYKQIRPTCWHDDAVTDVAFGSSPNTILTGSWDHTARVWELDQNEILIPADEIKTSHPNRVLTTVANDAGHVLITAGYPGLIKLWELPSGSFESPAQSQDFPTETTVFSVAVSPNGKRMLCGCGDEGFFGVALWDIENKPRFIRKIPSPTQRTVRCVSISPNGKLVAAGDLDGHVRVWQISDLENLSSTPKVLKIKLGAEASVASLAFSPDSKFLMTGSWGGDFAAHLWELDVPDDQEIANSVKRLQHNDTVWSIAFEDERTVLTGSWDHSAYLWDLNTEQLLLPPLQHRNHVVSVGFSPDKKLMLTGSWDDTARVWDRETGRLRGEKIYHSDSVRSAVFCSDGKLIATGSDDKTVRLWNVAQPAEEKPEQLKLSIEVRTGLTFDKTTEQLKRLSKAEWLDKVERLWLKFGGPCDSAPR